MSVRIKKINNKEVKPIPKLNGEDNRPILGAELIPQAFCNIFISAAKFSGKTTALFKILQECTGKNTKIIAFVSTLYNDDSWIYIQKYFKAKGIEFEGHTSIKEDGVDLLNELVQDLEDEAREREEEKEEEQDEHQRKIGGFKKAFEQANKEPESPKPRKPKYLAADLIIVLDDISNELKSKSLVTLLKKHRHYKTKTIISSQYYLDLLPESRNQIDYFLLFKGQTDKKLETIYRDAQLVIPYELFIKLYENAINKQYGFLYINKQLQEFRKGFSEKYEIPEY